MQLPTSVVEQLSRNCRRSILRMDVVFLAGGSRPARGWVAIPRSFGSVLRFVLLQLTRVRCLLLRARVGASLPPSRVRWQSDVTTARPSYPVGDVLEKFGWVPRTLPF
jgi:hypothetical protein